MLPICILAIRDDDDRAYMTRLFVKYQRLMYRTIYDILGDKWATEDVLQNHPAAAHRPSGHPAPAGAGGSGGVYCRRLPPHGL